MNRTAVAMNEPMLEPTTLEPGPLQRRIDDTLGRVTALVRERIEREGAATVEWFVRQFYANVPPADLANTPDEQLYGAALAMWQAARRRPAGTATVRVYTPRVEQAGWHAQRTIVEIVNDDMPFLVDSVTAELNRRGLTVHLVIHPVLPILRNAAGDITSLFEPGTDAPPGARPESLMHVQVNPVGDPAAQEAIRAGLEAVLTDVRAAVEDWRTIGSRIAESATLTAAARSAMPEGEAEEAAAFLAWMDEDNFTYLGARDYRVTDGDEPDLELIAGSGLGVLRDDGVTVFDGLRHSASLSAEVRDFLRQPRPLLVTKANRDSTVHRPVALDVVLIKRFDADGRIVGERLVVGLFTATAYNASPRDIPILRRKVAQVAARAGFDPLGHDGKALLNILETYPRDELFQIQPAELHDIAIGILHLQERQRLALFVRKDPFERFISALVFVPRDRFDTDLRRTIQTILEDAYRGRCSAFYTQLGDSRLARLHMIVQAGPDGLPPVDLAALEQRLVLASRGWADHLRSALIDANGEERGLALAARYADAFPVGYRDSHSAAQAVFDIGRIEQALAGSGFSINLGRPLEAGEDELHVTIHHVGRPIALSDTLPMLEHMDLRVITEEPFAVTPRGAKHSVWVQDFTVRSATPWPADAADAKRHFQDAFAAVWSGRMEDDGFNRLILRAGLTARDVVVLRAYAKFLKQARFAYAQDTVEATLASHPEIARLIARLFAARFDPKLRQGTGADEAPILEAIDSALDAVTNLDDDRILRRFVTLVRATLRTNAY
ncbi:NAD-glutamate dehydrogenase domain-containing protein, partial [Azospirillum griseum]